MRKSDLLSVLAVGVLVGSAAFANAAPDPDKNKKEPAAPATGDQPAEAQEPVPGEDEDQDKAGGRGKKARKKASAEQGDPAAAASVQVASAPVVVVAVQPRDPNRKAAQPAPAAPAAAASEPAPASAPAAAPEPPPEVAVPVFQVTGRIVAGQKAGALKVAVVDIGRAFDKIPAYQKLKKEDLKNTKARYHFLVAEANQKFQAAVNLVAARGSFDLVVEKGGVKGLEVADITDEVVEALD